MKLITTSFYSKNNKKVLKQKISSANYVVIEIPSLEFSEKFKFPKKISPKEKIIYTDILKEQIYNFYFRLEPDNYTYAELYDQNGNLLPKTDFKNSKYISLISKTDNSIIAFDEFPYSARYVKSKKEYLENLLKDVIKEKYIKEEFFDKRILVKHKTVFSEKMQYRLKPASIVLQLAYPLEHNSDFNIIKEKMKSLMEDEKELLEGIVGGSFQEYIWRMNFKFLPTEETKIVSEQGQWIGTGYEMTPEDAFKEGLKKVTNIEELKKENYEAYFLNYDISLTEIELWIARLY